MNASLNNRGASLTNSIDITAHGISLAQDKDAPQNILDTFISQKFCNIKTL